MSITHYRFADLDEAVAALNRLTEPFVLSRFEPVPSDTVIVAANPAAAANPYSPVPGTQPDRERDRDVSADVELEYMYHQLVERGHARQVVSLGGRLFELAATRVEVAGDDAVYAFVARKPLEMPTPC